MKKLITLFTAAIMAMSMAIPTSADMIFANPADVLEPEYINFSYYGFSGYYNRYYFDSNICYYENGRYKIDDEVGFQIAKEDGVYYMYSSRIEGEDGSEPPGELDWKKSPLAEVLAVTPRYEYKLEDMVTLQKYLMNNDSVLLRQKPYLDHNIDKEINAVDLSLIKYELLH